MLNGHNSKDPILKVGPEAGQELFMKFVKEASAGYPRDMVVSAAVNVVISALRQEYDTWGKAEQSFDDMFGKAKQLLHNHYDSTGRKRGIYPYDQTLSVPFVKLRKS